MNHETHNYLKGNDTFNPLLEGLEDTSILPFGGSVVETASSGPLEAIFHLIPAFPIYPPEFSWIREEREDWEPFLQGNWKTGPGWYICRRMWIAAMPVFIFRIWGSCWKMQCAIRQRTDSR